MKRRNPYPGLTRVVDRHGKVRWRFRMKGRPSCYIAGEFGSKEFEAAYERARRGESLAADSSTRSPRGTFSWLIEQYLRTPDFLNTSKIYQRNFGLLLDRFRQDHGDRSVAGLRRQHVEALMAKKAVTPAAANRLLKMLRTLSRFAIAREVIRTDPTLGIRPFKMNPDGWHTWTDDEILQFEAHHGIESKAVLALRLMLYTGAARQDAAAIGWQSIKSGRIEYRRHKTGQHVTLSLDLIPELVEALGLVPTDQMIFVTHGKGRAYSPASFGNWFGDQCRAAGLPHCSAHGLRKAGATRLANAGANELQIQAFLGHKTPDEARTYVKAANRAVMADAGMKMRLNVSNPIERLDNHRSNALKRKGK